MWLSFFSFLFCKNDRGGGSRTSDGRYVVVVVRTGDLCDEW